MKYQFCLRAVIFTALFSAPISGCISDGNPQEGKTPVAGTPVEFPTTISKTRAFDDLWEWGDEIGVYMISAAEEPRSDWDGIDLYAENKRYTHDMAEGAEPDDRVVFSRFDADNTIVWPGDGRSFDVVAYYPWRADIGDGYLYQVDLSDQSSQRAVDLMWSNNVLDCSSGAPALGFVHKLSKLMFNVTDTTGASLEGLTATFEGLPTTASFSLAAGDVVGGTESGVEPFEGFLAPTSDEDGDGVNESALVEAIVLPGSRPEGYTVTFTLAGGEQALFTVTAPDYEAGNRYVYTINLTSSANQGASFGSEGGAKQITGWSDGEGDPGVYEGNISKTGRGSGGGLSDAWSTDPGVQFASPVTVSSGMWGGTSYRLSGQTTIIKPGCQGIASVSVKIKLTSSSTDANATISSVKVGNHSLTIDHDGDPGTQPVDSFNIPVTTDPTDFVFRTTDGKPRSGDVKIEISRGSGTGTLDLYGFGTNTGN